MGRGPNRLPVHLLDNPSQSDIALTELAGCCFRFCDR